MITFTPINTITPLNKAGMINELESMMKNYEQKFIRPNFLKTIDTWGRKPTFNSIINRKSGSITAACTVEDQIYTWINDGTNVSYARFSHDFQSKTQPGVIQSRAGRGFFLGLTPRPKPGIQRRKFDEEIKKLLEKNIVKELSPHMSSVAAASGHKR